MIALGRRWIFERVTVRLAAYFAGSFDMGNPIYAGFGHGGVEWGQKLLNGRTAISPKAL
jgi:hypothetical protein